MVGSSDVMAWLGIPLVIFTAYCVYSPPAFLGSGLWVFCLTGPLGLYLVYLVTKRPTDKVNADIEAFRRFEVTSPGDEDLEGDADYRKKAEPVRSVLLNTVTAVPSELGILLDQAGGGAPLALLELHRGLAYLAINESDEYAVSDHTTVIMKLDGRAPTFTVRPHVVGEELPAQIIPFKKDLEFTQIFVVEGPDAKATRGFLSASIRDALLDVPEVWASCDGKVLAMTRYGVFDAVATRRLLEAADVAFAEHGAGGGPSLLEPKGSPVKSGLKSGKKKTKSKPSASPASAAT